MNNVNEVTIRQIVPVMAGSLVVFIKPDGRELYFTGKAEDIPERFMECTIREISTQAFYEDDDKSVNRYRAEIGFWIDTIPDWEERIR